MKIFIPLFILFICYSVKVTAQESYIGFNYGFGVTKITQNETSEKYRLSQTATLNGQIGINYTFIFKSNIVLASKPSYATYSFKLLNNSSSSGITYVYRFHYRNSPLLVGYRIKIFKNNSLSILGGLFYGSVVSATKEDRRFLNYIFNGPQDRYSIYNENNPKDIYGYMVELEFAQQISKKGYMVYRFNYHEHITYSYGEFFEEEIGITFNNFSGLIGMRLLLNRDDNIVFPIKK